MNPQRSNHSTFSAGEFKDQVQRSGLRRPASLKFDVIPSDPDAERSEVEGESRNLHFFLLRAQIYGPIHEWESPNLTDTHLRRSSFFHAIRFAFHPALTFP